MGTVKGIHTCNPRWVFGTLYRQVGLTEMGTQDRKQLSGPPRGPPPNLAEFSASLSPAAKHSVILCMKDSVQVIPYIVLLTKPEVVTEGNTTASYDEGDKLPSWPMGPVRTASVRGHVGDVLLSSSGCKAPRTVTFLSPLLSAPSGDPPASGLVQGDMLQMGSLVTWAIQGYLRPFVLLFAVKPRQ